MIEAPPNVHYWGAALDDEDDNELEYDPGMWWLAKSPDGSRLLLVHTRYGYPSVVSSADNHDRTIRSYASEFSC